MQVRAPSNTGITRHTDALASRNGRSVRSYSLRQVQIVSLVAVPMINNEGVVNTANNPMHRAIRRRENVYLAVHRVLVRILSSVIDSGMSVVIEERRTSAARIISVHRETRPAAI